MKTVASFSSLGVALAVSLAAAGSEAVKVPVTDTAGIPQTQLVHRRFAAVDKNRDGRLSRYEVRAHDGLSSSFATLDANNNTYLSEAEFNKWAPDQKDQAARNQGVPHEDLNKGTSTAADPRPAVSPTESTPLGSGGRSRATEKSVAPYSRGSEPAAKPADSSALGGDTQGSRQPPTP